MRKAISIVIMGVGAIIALLDIPLLANYAFLSSSAERAEQGIVPLAVIAAVVLLSSGAALFNGRWRKAITA